MQQKKVSKMKIRKEGEFIPPDGGWGWMIIVAAGFSNLATLPSMQQFGLLFRDKTIRLGISSAQITTILNMNAAMTSCVGLLNGPMFKLFTYRQIGLVGAIFISVGVVFNTFANNFLSYLLTFSFFYGVGFGINSSATALALNTYWKKRRRLATSLSWTATGLGPVIWPYVINSLVDYYGETGSVLIMSSFSLHAIALALLLHPVEWHSKKPNASEKDEKNLLTQTEKADDTNNASEPEGYLNKVSKNLSLFSSQYLYNEDDPDNPGYEIIEPGVPMMVKANDGYFSQSRQMSRLSSIDASTKTSLSKRTSMTNLTFNRSQKSSTLYLNESKKNSAVNLGSLAQEREGSKLKRKTSISRDNYIPESEIEDCPTLKAPQDLKDTDKLIIPITSPESVDPNNSNLPENKLNYLNSDYKSKASLRYKDENDDKKYVTDNHSNQSRRSKNRRKSNNFNYENEVLKQASLKLEEYLNESEGDDIQKLKKLLHGDDEDNKITNKENNDISEEIDDKSEMSFCQKVYMFFDLDLLKDLTFINLMLGLTLGTFNELNFSTLSPFILGDYGLNRSQIALYLSLLAGVDISVRFCIPLFAGRIGWENDTFFLIGVLIMTFGRVILSISQEYHVVLAVAVIIGFGKGLRTVFMALVLPSYVPLHKLPGATGIQLVTAGMVYLVLGPVIGWIKDHASQTMLLYSFNITTWMMAVSWGIQKYIHFKNHSKDDDNELDDNTV